MDVKPIKAANDMKRLLLPLLAALALPNAVNAGIEKNVAEFCLKAEDFSGCVQEMSAEKKSVLEKINKNNKKGGFEFLDQANKKYLNDNDYLTAINYLNDAIRINPNESEAYFVRGIINLLEIQDFKKALLDIQKSVQLDKQDSYKIMTLGYLKAIYFNQKESGLGDLNKAIDLNPEDSLAYMFRGRVNNLISYTHFENNDYQKVIKFSNNAEYDFSKSIEFYKKDFNPYFKRLFPFGYLHYLYASRGRTKFIQGTIYSYNKIKNKELSKKFLNSSLSDFDLLIEHAPTLEEVENLKNPIKLFELDYIKISGYTWKGNTYSQLRKFASACKNYKKVSKFEKSLDYDVFKKYPSIQDGWSKYQLCR